MFTNLNQTHFSTGTYESLWRYFHTYGYLTDDSKKCGEKKKTKKDIFEEEKKRISEFSHRSLTWYETDDDMA